MTSGSRPHNEPVTSPPQYCPTPRELDDLELLVLGALGGPAFRGPDDPVTLRLPGAVAEQAAAAGSVVLVDPEGVPLAEVTVSTTYDVTSAGEEEWRGVAGPVSTLTRNEYCAFRHLYRAPADVRAAVGR